MGRLRSIGRLRAGGSGFNPASLFAAGGQGAWYDPSDFSTMFQDSAGTTPVTAVGQPVGKVLDKSGRGNHLIQATTASRPTLQQDGSGFYYWNFDGVDDRLTTTWGSAITQPATVLHGTAITRTATQYIFDGIAASPSRIGQYVDATNNLHQISGNDITITSPLLTVGQAAVTNAYYNSASSAVRINGASVLPTTGNTGTDGSTGLSLGSSNSAGTFGALKVYGFIFINRQLTPAQIAASEHYIGLKCGVAL